jgi:hypothetical protein
MKRILWLAFFWLWWAGCESAPPTTEVLVVVDSDLLAGRDLKQLQVQVRDRASRQLLRSQGFELNGEGELPVSFSLYPVSGASSLRLVVTGIGLRNGLYGDLVERQMLVTFVPEQRRLLSVYLQASCLGQLCRDDGGKRTDQTCMSGVCESTMEAALGQAGVGLFGGYTMDGGRGSSGLLGDAKTAGDAGRNAGVVIACAKQSDCARRLGMVDPPGCAVARCVDGRCTFEAADADRDGDPTRFCSASGVPLAVGGDCNDGNPAVSSLEWDGPAGKLGSEQRADRCDGLDNDCNIVVDDALLGTQGCVCDVATDIDVPCSQLPDGGTITWPAGAPAGACKAGKRSCVDGAWTACMGAVTPRVIDSCATVNDDSNCNGVQGEGCQCTNGATRPCGVTVGSCRAGVQTCAGGVWGAACVGAVSPAAADGCDNGNDDNCNGVPNEGCKCINGSTSFCGRVLPALGDCFDRPITCTGGVWPAATCTAQCDDCPLTDPCLPGTCVDGRHTYSCECPDGYVGDGSSACLLLEECPAQDPCFPGACVDGIAGFSCACPAEYSGDGAKVCLPEITPCPNFGFKTALGYKVLCGPHTRCNFDNGTKCECDTGYVLVPNSDPPTCMAAGN